MRSLLKKPFMFFIVLAIGIAITVITVKSRKPLAHIDDVELSRYVITQNVAYQNFKTHVVAYGSVEPTIVLKMRSQVAGKVSYIHPGLKQGAAIPAGTVVLRIDPDDYNVSLKSTEADLSANESSLKQLDEEQKSTKKSLALAKENLKVGEKELKRVKTVWEKKLIARSIFDVEQQKVIQLRQSVVDLQGKVDTFASRKAAVNAQISRAKQQVKGQQTTLDRTEIILPFGARIGIVSVEKGEYLGVGTQLFEALDISGVEINAQLPVAHMSRLVSGSSNKNFSLSEPEQFNLVLSKLGLTAEVQLIGGDDTTYWDARVIRFSDSIDPVTRTMGAVVAIDNPYDNIIPGKKPPLMKGMYMAVNLYSPERQEIVLPRKAIHQGRVYIMNKNNRLEIRPVNVSFNQADVVVISSGLEVGERVVVSDMVPVIEGMLLRISDNDAVATSALEK